MYAEAVVVQTQQYSSHQAYVGMIMPISLEHPLNADVAIAVYPEGMTAVK